MGAEKDIIIAVELGSTAIRAIAGRKEPDGTTQVLAIAQETATHAIRKGIVDNIDKTTQAIARVVNELNERLDIYTTRIYVGLSGQSLRTIKNQVPYKMTERVQIKNELIDQLKDINRSVIYPNCTILEDIPQEYHIGVRKVDDPVGMISDQIEANFVNIVAKSSLAENIEKCVKDAGLEIAEMFITPTCLAEFLLNENEKRSGCALVDIGGDTTTVSVYSEKILRHLVVIPLGGSNVTADITSKGVVAEEAEKLKLKHGTAYYEQTKERVAQQIDLGFDRTISDEDFEYITEARYKEIIANVWNHLKEYGDNLLSGIVLTGGSSKTRNMTQGFVEYTEYKRPIRLAKNTLTNITLASNVRKSEDDNLLSLMALLLKGNETCVGEAPKKNEQEAVQEVISFEEEENTVSVTETTEEPEVVEEPKTQETEEEKQNEEVKEQPKKKKEKKPSEPFTKKLGRFWDKINEMLTDEG